MDFVTAVKTVLTLKYANFSGRACRSEYWWFVLFNMLASMILGIIDNMILGFPLLQLVYLLATIIPGIAVAVRRMHDVDKSGWWLLLALVPVANLYLIYLAIIKGTEGENRFGPAEV